MIRSLRSLAKKNNKLEKKLKLAVKKIYNNNKKRSITLLTRPLKNQASVSKQIKINFKNKICFKQINKVIFFLFIFKVKVETIKIM